MPPLAFGLLTAVAGCSSAASDWNETAMENTVTAYQKFMAAHPDDAHVWEARAFILQIKDDDGWAAARRRKTREAYLSYLQEHPRGCHAEQARKALASMDGTAPNLRQVSARQP